MWFQQVSAWKQMENWRNRQQALTEHLDNLATITSEMSGAGANYYAELANIGGQKALKRVQATAEAKRAERLAEAEKTRREEARHDAVMERLKVPEFVKYLGNKVNIIA